MRLPTEGSVKRIATRAVVAGMLATTVAMGLLPAPALAQAPPLFPPPVLDTMASDMRWTTDLGNAFLAQQPEVMDAV